MITQYKIIDTLDYSKISDSQDIVHITNSIIHTINFDTLEFDNKVIIESSIIGQCLIHACWFKQGLIFKNNHVFNYIDYKMGGHNEEPIILDGNIFMEFVNFFDCQFRNVIEIRNNVFMQGTNLLGNKEEGFANTFDKGWLVEGNIGKINVDGIGR